MPREDFLDKWTSWIPTPGGVDGLRAATRAELAVDFDREVAESLLPTQILSRIINKLGLAEVALVNATDRFDEGYPEEAPVSTALRAVRDALDLIPEVKRGD